MIRRIDSGWLLPESRIRHVRSGLALAYLIAEERW